MKNWTVVSDQLAAIRLYEPLGFVECGIDYEAFSTRGQFFDEILMTKPVGQVIAGNLLLAIH
ncbi:MAG: hypothetical protein ACSHX0_14240 [Akkermansiaceae bacterium]